jgi:NO-binding membrane sensor protein with MHYT domain
MGRGVDSSAPSTTKKNRSHTKSHLPSGFKTSEFFAAMLIVAVAVAFLAGGYYLSLHDKDTKNYFTGGSVIVGVGGLVVHFYGSGRVRLKEHCGEEHHG